MSVFAYHVLWAIGGRLATLPEWVPQIVASVLFVWVPLLGGIAFFIWATSGATTLLHWRMFQAIVAGVLATTVSLSVIYLAAALMLGV